MSDGMELNLEIVVFLVLLLAAALIFATLMIGWGTDATKWADTVISPIRNLIFGQG